MQIQIGGTPQRRPQQIRNAHKRHTRSARQRPRKQSQPFDQKPGRKILEGLAHPRPFCHRPTRIGHTADNIPYRTVRGVLYS